MSEPLFGNLNEIGRRVDRAPHLLVFLDFDGTLTPLQDHPDTVTLPGDVHHALGRLQTSPRATIAVISGRSLSDVRARVGLDGIFYAANHGLEIAGPASAFVDSSASAHRDLLQTIAGNLASRLEAVPGAFVEDKHLTISVHYRMADPSQAEEVRRLVHTFLAGAEYPFVLTSGNKVYEIRPRSDWNNGSALKWIREQLAQPDALAVVVGDDTPDEDAFAAAPDDITVKVGSPAETTARYWVEDTAQVAEFLKWLARRLEPV